MRDSCDLFSSLFAYFYNWTWFEENVNFRVVKVTMSFDKFQTQGDFMVLHYVARILELVIPLMDHPSESFLAQVEEDMIKLILKHGMMVSIGTDVL